MSFLVHTHVGATQEAWECPRRYREFTQLRKRLLRLGIDIPTVAPPRARDAGGRAAGGGVLSPELPKKTWRANKFDSDHLETRRLALEAYLQAAVTVGGRRRGGGVCRRCFGRRRFLLRRCAAAVCCCGGDDGKNREDLTILPCSRYAL